uniref:Uncharacterized protein n=1 Tax=Parascaris univalens TaxID=6257 RepID=A0A915BYR0_PARUN
MDFPKDEIHSSKLFIWTSPRTRFTQASCSYGLPQGRDSLNQVVHMDFPKDEIHSTKLFIWTSPRTRFTQASCSYGLPQGLRMLAASNEKQRPNVHNDTMYRSN